MALYGYSYIDQGKNEPENESPQLIHGSSFIANFALFLKPITGLQSDPTKKAAPFLQQGGGRLFCLIV